jgi:hypothetical protein
MESESDFLAVQTGTDAQLELKMFGRFVKVEEKQ